MGGFVRMKAFARTASDAEVVEAVRGDLARGPTRRMVQIAIGLLLILLGLLWALLFPQGALGSAAVAQREDLRTALVLGIWVGAIAGVGVMLGIHLIVEVMTMARHDRIDRLLVEYHDRAAGVGADAAEAPPDA